MVKSKIFKSAPMDFSFGVLIAPGIGRMEPVSFWPFPRVTGCCEHFYSHLAVWCIEECRWDGQERDAVVS